MNKDYQELLRAELERVSAGKAPSPDLGERAAKAAALPGNGQTPQGSAILQNGTSPQNGASSPNGAVPVNRGAAPSGARPLNGAGPHTAPVEMVAARKTQWKPVIEELPSLQQRTPAAEQFRRLRARLLEYRSSHALKVLLVSSAMPQEGKSFVTANLAVALNQYRGTRVLLIDGDMRRYSLQNYFGVSHRPGLPDFLSGKLRPEEIMQRADAATLAAFPGVANLTIIPGGGSDEHVSDLSEDTRFGELIAHVSPMFDWIIVDSSPVTLVADAVNMARHCDGVLLVVRAGVTKYETAQKAQAELQASTLLGVVLNAVEDRPAPSYYGYGISEVSE